MSDLDHWEPASSCDFNLKDQAHIWKIPLNISNAHSKQFLRSFDDGERERAKRFYFEKDRKSYISTRGQLRFLLGKYLQRVPTDFKFSYNEWGKPFLKDMNIQFNVSHSKAVGLLGFCLDHPIGVDIEWKRPDFGGLKIARRFFSDSEISELEGLSGKDQLQGFFNAWSRKEAYIKAVGKGLAIPLGKFSVSLAPNKECAIRNTDHDPEAIHKYKLINVNSDPEYASAVVVHSNIEQIRFYSID